MRAIASAALLVLLCAPSARAWDAVVKGDLVLYCDGGEPEHSVYQQTLDIVSDTEWALCRYASPLCPFTQLGGVTITGTTTWLSPKRGLFIGSSGGTVYEASFVLNRDGFLRSVRGRTITVARPDLPGSCAAQSRFRSVRRIKIQ